MMRTIERSTAFKKDYKREMRGRHKKDFSLILTQVLTELVSDKALAQKYCDHDLVGNWSGYRECHIKPDLLLIYSKPTDTVLRLARLGSHSRLFS